MGTDARPVALMEFNDWVLRALNYLATDNGRILLASNVEIECVSRHGDAKVVVRHVPLMPRLSANGAGIRTSERWVARVKTRGTA